MLTDEERAIYEWQMWTPDFGEAGQRRLKDSTVFVSRIGGVGGTLALQLAAAGVGRLILAHAGNVRPSDLNRQLLMRHSGIGKSRIEQAVNKLSDLNPRLHIDIVNENVTSDNASRLIGGADLIASCAPLFQERLAMNGVAVARGIPLVDCAMYDMDGQLTVVRPGRSACLRCLYPAPPENWKREFPVFGAVAGTVACLGACESIKLLAGVGEPLDSQMLLIDLRSMNFRKTALRRDPDCPTCSSR